MKKAQNIRDLLGLSQEELALVLNISRSQCSMFESGKRDLPLHAKQLLAGMLSHLKSANENAKAAPHMVQQRTEAQLHLEQLIRENVFHQERIQRRIDVMQKKYEANQKVLHLAEFFKNHPANKGNAGHPVMKSVAGRAAQSLQDEGLAHLIRHELKFELLVFEKMMLERKLEILSRSSVVTEI